MPDQSGIQGAFIETTDVYDVDVIRSLDIKGEEFKEFLVRLRQSTNNIAVAVNFRDAGYYIEELFNCGQVYFPNKTLSSSTPQEPTYRAVYRKVVDFGVLPNTGLKAVAHGIPNIDAQVTFSRIYATASDPVGLTYVPIPITFVATGNIIDIVVDAVNVTITTNFNATNFTRCLVVLEFFKG
jgi:hypothetical protein